MKNIIRALGFVLLAWSPVGAENFYSFGQRVMVSPPLTVATVGLTVAPVAAETYWLDARVTESIGSRWYLLRYGTVTLEPGETEDLWLSLATCPGGVASSPTVYVQPTGPGPWDYRPGWFHPVAYGPYVPDVAVRIQNASDGAMTFKLKATVRCEE